MILLQLGPVSPTSLFRLGSNFTTFFLSARLSHRVGHSHGNVTLTNPENRYPIQNLQGVFTLTHSTLRREGGPALTSHSNGLNYAKGRDNLPVTVLDLSK